MKNTKFPKLFFFKEGKKNPSPPPPQDQKIIGLHTNTSYKICVENIHKFTRYVEYACAYGQKKSLYN
jgi:hypothetical protein